MCFGGGGGIPGGAGLAEWFPFQKCSSNAILLNFFEDQLCAGISETAARDEAVTLPTILVDEDTFTEGEYWQTF
jgi:hypothetical protein